MALTDNIIHLENGRMAPDTPEAVVRGLARRAVENGTLVVHFHGGLVSETSGRETAERLYPYYANPLPGASGGPGPGGGAGAFPVFFVWESGLVETLKNNFAEIADEKIFRLIWKRLAAIVRRKLTQDATSRAAGVLPATDPTAANLSIDASLVRAAGADTVDRLDAGAPSTQGAAALTEAEQFALEQELQLDLELQMEAEAVTRGMRDPDEIRRDLTRSATGVRASSATLMDPRALDQLVDRPQPGSRGVLSAAKLIKSIVTVAARVLSRMARKRDHGWHATIIEEILRAYYVANVGGVIWGLMKQDTADCFQPDPHVYGGACFLDALRDEAAAAGRLPRIVLVGHSTGAIYISEFIEKACAILPPTADFGVIFLAAASRCDRTAATLTAHGGRIRNIRSFAMQDAVEKQDRLVPVLYPHSLLYFVSGVVEGAEDVPLVGMQRFYDAAHFPAASFPHVDAVRTFLGSQPGRTVWSVVTGAGPGLSSASTRHGDFDNDPVTLGSLRDMIRNGF